MRTCKLCDKCDNQDGSNGTVACAVCTLGDKPSEYKPAGYTKSEFKKLWDAKRAEQKKELIEENNKIFCEFLFGDTKEEAKDET